MKQKIACFLVPALTAVVDYTPRDFVDNYVSSSLCARLAPLQVLTVSSCRCQKPSADMRRGTAARDDRDRRCQLW